jgi:hypothetical protein
MNNFAIEVHAPSLLALVVGVLAALVAIFFYFNPTVSHHVDYAFGLMTLAYVATSLFCVLRT